MPSRNNPVRKDSGGHGEPQGCSPTPMIPSAISPSISHPVSLSQPPVCTHSSVPAGRQPPLHPAPTSLHPSVPVQSLGQINPVTENQLNNPFFFHIFFFQMGEKQQDGAQAWEGTAGLQGRRILRGHKEPKALSQVILSSPKPRQALGAFGKLNQAR